MPTSFAWNHASSIDFLRLLSSPRRVAAAEQAILAALEWGPDQPVLVWSQR